MSREYIVRFTTTLAVAVTVEAEDEDEATDLAWQKAEEYAQTLGGNHRDVVADATFDGKGYDEIEAAS